MRALRHRESRHHSDNKESINIYNIIEGYSRRRGLIISDMNIYRYADKVEVYISIVSMDKKVLKKQGLISKLTSKEADDIMERIVLEEALSRIIGKSVDICYRKIGVTSSAEVIANMLRYCWEYTASETDLYRLYEQVWDIGKERGLIGIRLVLSGTKERITMIRTKAVTMRIGNSSSTTIDKHVEEAKVQAIGVAGVTGISVLVVYRQ